MKAIIIKPHMATYRFTDGKYQDIRDIIGNWIDCVRGDDFVGYVDDEGLVSGLEFNPIASILFGQYLVGDVVVFGSLDENGSYDGNNYDVPESVVTRLNHILAVMNLHRDHSLVEV
jgi:hypothetical protein